ncbi:MAG: UDP-glucose 4-epimerase GalE [Tissierellia bacterium]|nr:UDP-glucose 4-epimerase GalE [Tissierellia bacterium]
MSVLIIGGAGYIGSHTVKLFQERGLDVVVLDNLSTGHRELVDVEHFYEGDCRDSEILSQIFTNHNIDTVVHFAALSLVGVSMTNPYDYYHNNVYGAIILLGEMVKHNVKNIVFSSTAAVYGEPNNIPIMEEDPTFPTNPYGETKLAMEKMMSWFDTAYGIKYVALRYFNAAGADSSGKIGELHQPETHLIPLILQVPLGKRDQISIFGTDYPTDDGTCVRDYIHVNDLADAHFLAFQYLAKDKTSNTFNLGNGKGFSVLEVIDTARKVTGHPIPATEEGRRPGDPAVLVASSQKAEKILGWKPKLQLEDIISSAWNFHKNNKIL